MAANTKTKVSLKHIADPKTGEKTRTWYCRGCKELEFTLPAKIKARACPKCGRRLNAR